MRRLKKTLSNDDVFFKTNVSWQTFVVLIVMILPKKILVKYGFEVFFKDKKFFSKI